MTRADVVYRIYSSDIALIILYGLPFGLISYLVGHGDDASSLILYSFSGLFFGVLMMLTQRKRLRKTLRLSKDQQSSENKRLEAYIKRTEIPDTEKDRQELRTYIRVREENRQRMMKNYYPKRYSKVAAYTTIIVFFAITVTSKQLRPLAVIYPIVLLAGVYGELAARSNRKKISVIRQKLKSKG